MIKRHYFNNLAGASHLIGNLLLMAKNQLMQPEEQWAYLAPTTLAGSLFIAAAGILTLWGHKRHSLTVGHSVAIIGYGFLAFDLLCAGWHWDAAFGVMIGITASSYVLAQACDLIQWTMPVKHVQKQFQHNAGLCQQKLMSLTRRFPLWPAGLTELTADLAFVGVAVRSGDAVLLVVGLCWIVGSAFFTVALPGTSVSI